MAVRVGRVCRYLWVVLACVGLVVSGCAAAKKGSAQLPLEFDPERMFLQSSPYDRLLVKVDRVEGTQVDPRWLAEMKDFLVACCNKPNGVKLVQAEPIPLKQAKGLSPNEIAGLRLEPTTTPRTAYLYVLFYDSKKLGMKRPDNPHVSYGDYPCAIYYDVAYARKEQGYFAANALRHEAGHALGLCKDRSHGDGAHCSNKNCLMYWTFVLKRDWYKRPPARKQLCAACMKDLREAQAGRPDATFFFAGPVLVRQEKDYWVLSYPGMVGLAFDKQQAMDWQGLLRNYRAWIQSQGRRNGSSIYAVWQLKARGKEGVTRLKKALDQARRDPSLLVQDTAKEAQRELQRELKRKPLKVAASLDLETEWAGASLSR